MASEEDSALANKHDAKDDLEKPELKCRVSVQAEAAFRPSHSSVGRTAHHHHDYDNPFRSGRERVNAKF
jgi:hypothetical protein